MPNKNKENLEKKNIETNSKIDNELDLSIPSIPIAPKKKEKLKLDSTNVSEDVFKKIQEYKAKKEEVILVNCSRCKGVIAVPAPKEFIENSDLPVVPISYVHKNLENKDQHCITLYLDHDFDVRRQRISDVIILE